jgi:hypothetical protein
VTEELGNLSVLKEAGIVNTRRNGVFIYYALITTFFLLLVSKQWSYGVFVHEFEL